MRKPKTITLAPPKDTTTPKPFLPSTVERIAAAVADMLTYGGTPVDQERLILAAVSQEYRGKTFCGAGRSDVEASIREDQRHHLPLMLRGLADFRIDRPKFEDEQPVAAAVAERIRLNSRELCAREFRDFVRNADPEEVRFLYTVLNWWSSKGCHDHELSIATAFQDEIDSNIEIFRVPAKYSAAVDAYIAALMKAKPEKEVS